MAFDKQSDGFECLASVGTVVLDSVETRVALSESPGADTSVVGLKRKGDTWEILSKLDSLSSFVYVLSLVGDCASFEGFLHGLPLRLSALIDNLRENKRNLMKFFLKNYNINDYHGSKENIRQRVNYESGT